MSYFPSPTDDDLLPVVNEADEQVGTATRKEVHEKKLLHRAVHIVVFDPEKGVLLQKRSLQKDSYPGWWDISVGGHVDVDESYKSAAVREMKEELGIEETPVYVDRRSASELSGFEFVHIYEVESTGPFSHDQDEIDDLRWISFEDLNSKTHSDPETQDPYQITSSGLISLKLWLDHWQGDCIC